MVRDVANAISWWGGFICGLCAILMFIMVTAVVVRTEIKRFKNRELEKMYRDAP